MLSSHYGLKVTTSLLYRVWDLHPEDMGWIQLCPADYLFKTSTDNIANTRFLGASAKESGAWLRVFLCYVLFFTPANCGTDVDHLALIVLVVGKMRVTIIFMKPIMNFYTALSILFRFHPDWNHQVLNIQIEKDQIRLIMIPWRNIKLLGWKPTWAGT